MDKLWEQRQDFKVWIPLLETSNRPYVYVKKYKKEKYYEDIQKCCVGFSPKQLEEVKNGETKLLAHGEKEEK